MHANEARAIAEEAKARIEREQRELKEKNEKEIKQQASAKARKLMPLLMMEVKAAAEKGETGTRLYIGLTNAGAEQIAHQVVSELRAMGYESEAFEMSGGPELLSKYSWQVRVSW